MARRVWYLHHAESECVMKVYSDDEAMHHVMYDGCDIINFLAYKRLAKEYGQDI